MGIKTKEFDIGKRSLTTTVVNDGQTTVTFVLRNCVVDSIDNGHNETNDLKPSCI